ncbi:amino acid adenylation domain-containing protein [Streptomyces sp. NPDC031705]|uniref:amino acid adenylation domain-containing protein n=1 Tax=Streptomyces sp. NPDC031705 TaxID=3155729 RepID=UPI0034113772
MFWYEHILDEAERQPDTIALADPERPVSYGELAAAVRAVSARLRQLAPGRGRIAVQTHKTPTTIAAMIAVLHSGHAYVPLDPASPPERRRFVLRDASCALLLTTRPDPVDTDLPVPVLVLPENPADLTALHRHLDATTEPAGSAAGHPRPAAEPDSRTAASSAGADAEAYVLYTSGSTGTPKGVVISRRNVTAFLDSVGGAYPLRRGDQVAVHAPLHFDLPVYDVYAGLAAGATLHLVPERTALFPQALLRFLQERRVSHLYAVPSALTALLHRSSLEPGALPDLRQVLYAGEEFRPSALASFLAAVAPARVANLYGPIETNVVTALDIEPHHVEAGRVPLGYPVPGVTLALLTEDGTASERAVAEGEIMVAGDSVTPGYLNRPELTADATVVTATESGTHRFYRTGDFARRDEGGLLHLLGRRDGLVKTRGYRVELGEVEAVLGDHPLVADVAVLAVPDPRLTHTLTALVVPSGAGADLSEAELSRTLTQHCRTRMPAYMVPGSLGVVAELPRTSTGKIARAALRDLAVPSAGGTR